VAATSGSSTPSSSSSSSSSFGHTPPLKSPPPTPETPVTPVPKPELPPAPLLSPSGSVYTSPGIVTVQGGDWVGNEHLFNLTTEVGIVIEIVGPKGVTLPFSESILKEKVVKLFQEAKIPVRLENGSESLLPFFHLLLMINPIEKGFVAYCSGRLFENVQVSRINLPAGIIWQAITWEKQELILFGTTQLQEQVFSVVERVVNAFVTRYKEQNK
jgi:hypothetical protein